MVRLGNGACRAGASSMDGLCSLSYSRLCPESADCADGGDRRATRHKEIDGRHLAGPARSVARDGHRPLGRRRDHQQRIARTHDRPRIGRRPKPGRPPRWGVADGRAGHDAVERRRPGEDL